ncbi:hypothetical protein PoB_002283300 [Plakobranchus ocellatus]|uniref:Uncharacterized protein n=1 Tax=Plakobranchus ocellatus TaxID=259542 RepID=A0AAV3ZP17_9GAST|nr:hypothetical protein PoB_002283300 [Plakobranchus ocellatus]
MTELTVTVPSHSECPQVFRGTDKLQRLVRSCARPLVKLSYWGVGGTVANESALRSAVTLLSWVRTPPPAP